LGCASGNLRAGNFDTLVDLVAAQKGAVNLYSIVNDAETKIKLIIDKKLVDSYEYVGFHPMVNTATTAVAASSLVKIAELAGHEPEILDFTTISSGESAAQAKPKPQKQPKQEKPKKEAK